MVEDRLLEGEHEVRRVSRREALDSPGSRDVAKGITKSRVAVRPSIICAGRERRSQLPQHSAGLRIELRLANPPCLKRPALLESREPTGQNAGALVVENPNQQGGAVRCHRHPLGGGPSCG